MSNLRARKSQNTPQNLPSATSMDPSGVRDRHLFELP